MRQRTLLLLHTAREYGGYALKEYAEERMKYKILLKEKKLKYDTSKEQELIAEVEMKPHKILRSSKKQKSSPLVNMKQWEDHFSNLLGAKDKTQTASHRMRQTYMT
ncbi:hypothetical protein L9F63_023930 [Diploptera punctata]|uniref:Uncharacterized protein n=1 Tax=Diploptera punctata TaxID=6984 RepID=A0AAD8E887_DIPPU|nr:hypothetical protein L9F63_023930 [Diploptera punctata]